MPVTTPTVAGTPGAAPVMAQPNNGSSSPINATYFKSPAESVDQYNARIQDYNNSSQNQPASEPAVLSSEAVNNQIDEAQSKLSSMTQKGTTVDQNGNVAYADGSAVPAPPGATYNSTTGQYEATDGKTYGAAEFYGQDGNAPDPDYVAIQKLFAPVKAQLDANTLSQVNNIQSQYEDLITQQKQLNDNAAGANTHALLLAGTSQYAPLDASGITLAKASYGLQQIKNLDAQENTAISNAQQAQQTGDYKAMTDALTMAENIRTQKQKAASDISTSIQTANENLATQKQQSTTDNAIAQLLDSGMTDPSQILEALNNAGLSVTSDQVAATMKNIADNTGSAGIKGLTGDVGNFYTLKATPGALPASILALPADQQLAAYIRMVNQAKSTKAASTVSTSAAGNGSASGNAPAQLNATDQAWVTAVLNGNATMQQVPAASRNAVAVGLTQQPATAYSPLAASRFTTAANKIATNFVNLPQYQLTANGLPYLQRIDAAMQNPGSVSDQDLLDSLTKLNTAGNAISDEQVKIITDGQSWSDTVGTALNKVQNGGVLSNNQRQQIQSIAKAIFANYQKGYQPVYDQVTQQLTDAGIPKAFWTIPNLNDLSAQIGSTDSNHPDIGSSDTLSSFLSSAPSPSSVGGNVDWTSVQI